ncbi:hypothetical protein H310_02920 [Aphanomyces invadans]|uniref:Uncharacterized protein n=2 Tax=Aphanomyces invadans TaxID=157072 RepID=A0A024UMA2_9STRA|nr:hypothetical protein H310_02920 [Aphanomyces invadans]ETW06758.1 hypothetical protein H310_02920 [Aphanomyces invadans]|eukprot:XP_008864833.1 hypothetical protein H310_02920 [Aphanomyces invadans]
METVTVQDAETGEWLEVTLPKKDDGASGGDEGSVDDDNFGAATNSSPLYEKAGMFTPYAVEKQGPTQSTRKLGTSVSWQQKCDRQRQKQEKKDRTSLHGLQRQLANQALSKEDRRMVEVKIVEALKGMYKRQQEALINEEIEREHKRYITMGLEKSIMGKARLKRQFDVDRGHHRSQIERIREECNMSLAAIMTKFNMLR